MHSKKEGGRQSMQVGFSRDKGMFINRFERRHSKILGRYKNPFIDRHNFQYHVFILYACDFHEME